MNKRLHASVRRTALTSGLALTLALAAQAEEIERVDVGSDGTAAGYDATNGSSLSDDGRYAAFVTFTALSPLDQDDSSDVYRRDLQTGETTLVSDGVFNAYLPQISGDGERLVFLSNGAVILRDVAAGTTLDVGRLPSVVALGALGDYRDPAISGDGGTVAFIAQVTPPDPETAVLRYETFVVDVASGTAEVASVTPSGERTGGASSTNGGVALNEDGRVVAFFMRAEALGPSLESGALYVVLRDRDAGTTAIVSTDEAGRPIPSAGVWIGVSDDGSLIAFADGVGATYVHDTATGRSEIDARNDCGGVTFAGYEPRLDAVGRRLADGSGTVYDRATGETIGVDVTPSLGQRDEPGFVEDLSADGRYALFRSDATDLPGAGPSEGGGTGLYRRDLGVPVAADGAPRTTQFDLPPREWVLMSLPCPTPDERSLVELFEDDIPGTFGTAWIAYTFDTAASPPAYVRASDVPTPQPGEGFWIIQLGDDTVRLDLPLFPSFRSPVFSPSCPAPFGCDVIELEATPGRGTSFDLIGTPSADRSGVPYDGIVVETDTDPCFDGCPLAGSDVNDTFVFDLLYGYEATSGYTTLGAGARLLPWQGFWAATTHPAGSGDAPRLLMPAAPASRR